MSGNKEKKYVSDNAQLMAEWNWERNADVSPSYVTLGSHKKIWWKCSKGHEWQAQIANRAVGCGCPYCAGKKILIGYNDLQTINPVLASEWSYEKNDQLKPENFTLNSNKKVWWKCNKGHEWQATIYNRNNGCGCPYCASQKVLKGYNDLQTLNPGLASEWNHEKNGRLKPENLTVNSNKKIWWKCSNNHEWQAVVAKRNRGDGCPYCSGKKVLIGYNDLQTLNASLASEWNYEKNEQLKPENFTASSSKTAWWKCSQGHEWQATIKDRNNGNGCPYCANQKILAGYNDLQTVNPVLAKEWHHAKNGQLKPEFFGANSHTKVWWKCSKGHEWQSTIAGRNRGRGCPYCAGQKAISGQNDLETVNPILAKEWNYEKNNGVTPTDVLPKSNKKVWWRCAQGHEWQAVINSRVSGHSCPYCSGRFAIKGINDLKTLNPILANEWLYEKNGQLQPEDFTANSHKKVWWKCSKGHEWQATINHRNRGCGCPICNSERHTSFPEYALVYYLKKCGFDVIHSYKKQGYELDVYIPSLKIAIEYDGYYWHKNKIKKDLEKNIKCKKDGIKLYRIREGLPPLNDSSIDYVVLEKGKNLEKIIRDIIGEIIENDIDIDLQRDTFAIENLREYTEKENSILFSNYGVAKEWNYEKNGKLKPENFTANSSKTVWWMCSKGHEWQAKIADRNKGRGCPYCSGRYAIQGENDLQTVNPNLAKEWNYEKNNGLTPWDILPNSHKKVWWKCPKRHEWEATIRDRNKGNGCPECAREKRKDSL